MARHIITLQNEQLKVFILKAFTWALRVLNLSFRMTSIFLATRTVELLKCWVSCQNNFLSSSATIWGVNLLRMSKNLQKDGKHVLKFTHCYWSSFTAVSLGSSDDSVPKDERLFFNLWTVLANCLVAPYKQDTGIVAFQNYSKEVYQDLRFI